MTDSERSALVNASVPKFVRKGEVIFLEEEYLQRLFCIHEGACKFSKVDEKGREHITRLLGKGELMGRRSLISKKGAMVTATAISDTMLCSVDKKPVLECLKKNPNFCIDVLRGFVKDTEEDIKKKDLFENHQIIKKRLAGLLIYLLEKFGISEKGCLDIFLKREDMANLLGTSSEYVITLLTKFKVDGLIALNRREITILDLKGLHKIL
jgi:CRP-like cAMP-binding protein